ncbi:hypothetical protein G6F23_013730 [Rhizopus arrhizus]|nr:hypothetical protein G6F23_013730 [Rhizopus arrhizus]
MSGLTSMYRLSAEVSTPTCTAPRRFHRSSASRQAEPQAASATITTLPARTGTTGADAGAALALGSGGSRHRASPRSRACAIPCVTVSSMRSSSGDASGACSSFCRKPRSCAMLASDVRHSTQLWSGNASTAARPHINRASAMLHCDAPPVLPRTSSTTSGACCSGSGSRASASSSAVSSLKFCAAGSALKLLVVIQ